MKITKSQLKQIIKEELQLFMEHEAGKIDDDRNIVDDHCSAIWGPPTIKPQGSMEGEDPVQNHDYHKCMKYAGWPITGYEEPE